ncbi:MAG: hypothetical protein H8E22_02515 [Candidatus Cloacimonetes bacterium]|nr:hypothetical protein [Candidatus Cloacimonadota bacterium]
MKLHVGLLKPDHGFETIFQQYGIPYTLIKDNNLENLSSLPVIIVNSVEDKYSKEKILQYVASGGSILTTTKSYRDLFQCNIKKKYISYTIANDSIYKEVGLVDFYHTVLILTDKELSSLSDSLYISHRCYKAGCIINIPFDVQNLIGDFRSSRKKFYSQRKELPSEIVSCISKDKIGLIVYRTIEYLFHKQNLPFVHAWFYPDEYENLFSFRVDTDFCNADDASSLLSVCDKNAISGTWFLDTASKEMLGRVYSQLNDQEVALHCDRHLVYEDYKQNYENIGLGLKKLQRAGFDVHGFAAPFGEWNPTLDKALNDLNFNYSSEFAYAYDDFPLFHEKSHVLQIPIHPISIGRLRRSHFTDDEMLRYYQYVIHEKIKTSQPIIIYHHPHHQRFDILNNIFRYVNEYDFWKPTMFEYYSWWKERNKSTIQIHFDKDTLKVKCNNPKVVFRITHSNRDFSFIKSNQYIKLCDIKWKEKDNLSVPADILRTRKWHWRDALYNMETKKAKAGK